MPSTEQGPEANNDVPPEVAAVVRYLELHGTVVLWKLSDRFGYAVGKAHDLGLIEYDQSDPSTFVARLATRK